MHEKLGVKLVIYKDHTGIHRQQNIKFYENMFSWPLVATYGLTER